MGSYTTNSAEDEEFPFAMDQTQMEKEDGPRNDYSQEAALAENQPMLEDQSEPDTPVETPTRFLYVGLLKGQAVPVNELPAEVREAVNDLFSKLDEQADSPFASYSRRKQCLRTSILERTAKLAVNGVTTLACSICARERLPCVRHEKGPDRHLVLPLPPALRKGLAPTDPGYWINTKDKIPASCYK